MPQKINLFDIEKKHFGDVKHGQELECTFEYVKTTDELPEIECIFSFCNCMTPKLDGNKIHVKTKVTNFAGQNQFGFKQNTIKVHLNDGMPSMIINSNGCLVENPKKAYVNLKLMMNVIK